MSAQKPTQSFYDQGAIELAPQLLGMELIHTVSGAALGGIIVETESYLPSGDPACHAYCGLTGRNRPMFSRGGVSYVYLIYGMYNCFNVVSGANGDGEAVLIRAIQPLYGVSRMEKNRKRNKIHQLCSGPGKLCQALEISRDHNDLNLLRGTIELRFGTKIENKDIEVSGRIGIREGADLPYRFSIRDSPYVSPGKPVGNDNLL